MPLQKKSSLTQDDDVLQAHALRVLSGVCETGAILAVASGMDKAIVLGDMRDGPSAKTVVIYSVLAQDLALKPWISCRVKGC
ncbi:MAG: helix-turn-helix domain containing protein, partial [Paracoccaceae bacterium]|nr:helix-turn-helix domain containing protein [Paracoccaceae bacterium]